MISRKIDLILAGLFWFLLVASSQAQTTLDGRDRSASVDALMVKWFRENTPGAAVAVIRNGEVLHNKGYGLADLKTKEGVNPKTKFDIASVSKPFTAMAILMLVERGKLSFSDTLSRLIPGVRSEVGQITVRQMLSHTSGLPDYTLAWGETARLKDNLERTTENAVRYIIKKGKLRFEPGGRWEYSNSNYVLLAHVVSTISGEPFPEFVNKNIFRPLGMYNSFVYDRSHAEGGGQAAGYVSQGNGFRPANRNPENYVYGDGQVNSTIEDMTIWDQALYGEKLIKASTMQQAFAPGQLNDGTRVNYGFGWGIGRYRGLDYVGHGGETDGFVAQITRFPSRRFTIIFLSNIEQTVPPFAIANKIADIYLADVLRSTPAVQLEPGRLSDYAGKYRLYDVTLVISLDGGSLWITTPDKKRIKLVPVSANEFLIDGSQGGSSIEFKRNSHGNVTGLTLLDQNGTTWHKQMP